MKAPIVRTELIMLRNTAEAASAVFLSVMSSIVTMGVFIAVTH